MIISSSLKCSDDNNQDEDTSLNRSMYNNDNSSFLKCCDNKKQDEGTSLNRSMYSNE